MRWGYGLCWVLVGGLFLLASPAWAACPTRTENYVAGTEIEPDEVNDDFDTLYEGIQAGLDTDCIANNAITTAKIATGAVTSSDILDGTITTSDLAFSIAAFNALPAGSVFFMLSGSCPSWTTDVSATYSNLFLRVNATAGTSVGADTHTHTAGTFAEANHQHETTMGGIATQLGRADNVFGSGSSQTITASTTSGGAGSVAVDLTSSAGSATITGTSASGSNIPAALTGILCQVN